MKSIILCAGEGTRLRPITYECPKCMIRVGDKPLLEYLIILARNHGITEIAINLFHLPDSITDYFGDGGKFGVNITYSPEEELLGSAGAVKRLEGFLDETFVVIYGDLLTDLDLTKMAGFHQKHNAPVTVSLYQVPNPEECGLVETTDNDRIVRFVEKPDPDDVFTDWANAGVYIIEPEIIKYIPNTHPYDFGSDLFPKLLNEDVPLYGYRISEELIDIGSPYKLEKANRMFKEKRFDFDNTR